METFLVVLPLVPHPDHPAREIAFVSCTVAWRDAGDWAIDFFVAAPPAALKLPAAAAPERADGLWQATCFELFLRNSDGDAYLEFNFSPSGQWAAYRFDSYRQGMKPLDVAPPRILTTDPGQFALCAALEDPRLAAGASWLVGLSAIIEEVDGTKSYWAISHPPGAPDFHHGDCFALELPPAPAP